MGASLKSYLCADVEKVNNRLVIFHRAPTTCFGVKHQFIAIELQADATKISQECDQLLTNQDSLISQEGNTVTLLKNSQGIVTSPHKISEAIQKKMVELNEKAVQKIVFKEPRASSANKEMIYRAIFEALYNFSSFPISHTKSVYIDWIDLSAGQMKEIRREMINERTILAQE